MSFLTTRYPYETTLADTLKVSLEASNSMRFLRQQCPIRGRQRAQSAMRSPTGIYERDGEFANLLSRPSYYFTMKIETV